MVVFLIVIVCVCSSVSVFADEGTTEIPTEIVTEQVTEEEPTEVVTENITEDETSEPTEVVTEVGTENVTEISEEETISNKFDFQYLIILMLFLLVGYFVCVTLLK